MLSKLKVFFLLPYSFSHAPIILRLHNIEEEIWQNRLASVRGLHYALYQKMANDIRDLNAWRGLVQILFYPYLLPIKNWFENCPEVSTEVIPIGMVADHIAQPNRITGGGLRLGLIASWDWSPNAEAGEWLLDEIVPRLDVLDNWTLHLAGRNMPSLVSQEAIKPNSYTWRGQIGITLCTVHGCYGYAI